jgi:hypothetical protein
MLFPSPRYGTEALVKLIGTVDAKVMLVPETPVPVCAEVLQKREMKKLQVPSAEALLTANTEPYPFTKTFEEHKHEPLICLRKHHLNMESILEALMTNIDPHRHIRHDRLSQAHLLDPLLGEPRSNR